LPLRPFLFALALGCLIAAGGASVASAHLAGASGKGSLDLSALPLGDKKLSTGPRRGSIWTCRIGAGQRAPTGPWIHGSTWSFLEKPIVTGSVSYPGALSVTRIGSIRHITANDLPLTHTTGLFPIQPGTTAFQYDPGNRAGIAAHSIDLRLPAKPKLAKASCVGGEVGILNTGVALFDGFDADGFDAPAHEMQDSCSGHPNNAGYHYHSLPACLNTGKSGRHSNQIGWALDGFPLFGPRGENGEYMKDNDLDACHGHIHKIKIDGKVRRLYHYHVTQQFPYSAGCFRGAPGAMTVLGGG
jgi:hypothetical protein